MTVKSIFSLNRPLCDAELNARRRSLMRLGLAWLAMMQVMMFALPGYLSIEVGPNDRLDILEWAIFLMNWASLTLTLPVVLYAAWPIWQGVVRACRHHRITMDIPVALSVTAAFIPSAYATIGGVGEVYFDSVTMFIAFLLTARYFEERARQSLDLSVSRACMSDVCQPLVLQSDRIAMIFVLTQLTVACVMTGFWWLIAPQHVLSILVALLVMSCPCALALAAPMSLAAMQATLAAYPTMSESQRKRLYAQTSRVTRQNLYGALFWHVLTMPLAALGWVTPWLAALLMFVSSMAVIANAWRLYTVELDPACTALRQRRRVDALI